MPRRTSDNSENVSTVSTLTSVKLANMLKAHQLLSDMKFIIPTRKERGSEPPEGLVAFSDSIIKSSGVLPLHPFSVKVLNYFELAPLQLSPNSWVVLSCLYVLYKQVHSRGPSMSEVHHLYTLRANPTTPGFYQLQKVMAHTGYPFVEGSISNRGSWKSDLFFTPSVSTQTHASTLQVSLFPP